MILLTLLTQRSFRMSFLKFLLTAVDEHMHKLPTSAVASDERTLDLRHYAQTQKTLCERTKM